jgi:RNA polymerase sigma-70 factor, ECF subfamily
LLDEQDQLAVIGGLRAGNRDAWATLYESYSVDLWRYVARLLGPQSAVVADVVQEAFLEAARSARQFDTSRGTLWSWLAGIAHHKVAAHWRQVGQVNRLLERAKSDGAAMQQSANDFGGVGNSLEQKELVESIRRTLADLPAEYSALLSAKYLDGHSLEDLSRQWGSSVDATKSKLARARREFRETFDRIANRTDSPATELK